MQDTAERLAALAQDRGLRIAVAESLTGGTIAAELGKAPGASDWFLGGVVAWSPQVKYDVLGVAEGPVMCLACAEQMARGVARLMGADAAVATTGVGGPDPVEDEPAGSVFVATLVGDVLDSRRLQLSGDPADVVDAARVHALTLLAEAVQG